MKNDRRDATSLAQKLRTGNLPRTLRWDLGAGRSAVRRCASWCAFRPWPAAGSWGPAPDMGVIVAVPASSCCAFSCGMRCTIRVATGARRPHRSLGRWLSDLSFEPPAQRLVLEKLVQLIAEIGSFSRIESPRQPMAYPRLMPSAPASGRTTRWGPITPFDKRGDRQQPGVHLPKAWIAVEAIWTWRFPARVADHPQAHGTPARADPGCGVEGAGQALPTLSPADGYRQVGARAKAWARWSPPSPATWSASSGPSPA